MTQIHKALSHYWHLRDQGKSQADARAHVRQRFGVEIDPEQPLASTSHVVREVPAVGSRFVDFENDECVVIEAPNHVILAEGEFFLRYESGVYGDMTLVASLRDVTGDGSGLDLRPVEGSRFEQTTTVASNPQGLMGTS